MKKKHAEELKHKIEFLDAKLNQSDDSDESEDEQQKQTGEVSDKADALYQAQQILPFCDTKLSEFLKAMTEISSSQVKEVLKQLKEYFKDDPNWQNEANSEIDLEKFLKSILFKVEGNHDNQALDWKLLSIFALFTCKQKASTAVHRIALRIARESTASNDLMDKELFQKFVNSILQMASINFIKAVVEIGYMDDLFHSSHYEEIQSSIDTISQDLARDIFGEILTMKTEEWIKKAHSVEHSWLFSFLTIREKIFTVSTVDTLHINEKEAERLFNRLKRQQQILRE